jgi:hypothetical protein
MGRVSEMREQMKAHPGVERYIFKEGKLIQPEDVGIGDILEIVEDDNELNAIPQVYLQRIDDPDKFWANYIDNVTWRFLYRIQRRKGTEWVDIPNEEGIQPQVLLKQGILHPGDVIRFLDIDDEVSPVVITAEEALIDMNGLFYIGIDYENYRDSVSDELFEAVDPDDDEEEDEVDEDEHEHFHLVPEIVSASTIVEFVKMSMSTIKKIGVIIDEIEENED